MAWEAPAGCEGCSAAAGWGQKKILRPIFSDFRSPSHVIPVPSPSLSLPHALTRRCRKPRQRQPKYHLSHSFFAPSFSHCHHHEVYRCPLSIRPPRFCPVFRTLAFTVHTRRHLNKKCSLNFWLSSVEHFEPSHSLQSQRVLPKFLPTVGWQHKPGTMPSTPPNGLVEFLRHLCPERHLFRNCLRSQPHWGPARPILSGMPE